MPAHVFDELAFFRYREKLHLTYAEAASEPAEEILKALMIWSLDAERVKLEEARNAAKNGG